MSAKRDLPSSAACRHLGAREGFEVLFMRPEAEGYRLDGQSTAVEDGEAWSLRYSIVVDADWLTRSAHVIGRSASGTREVSIEGDGSGGWRVDGRARPELAGLLDVDLEASAFTNAFPVHRLALEIGGAADAPAVYVRAPDLRVERLEQHYARLVDDGSRSRYDYKAPAFDFAAVLVFDESGLIVDYPGLAVRVL
jgi:uncharacterized protein